MVSDWDALLEVGDVIVVHSVIFKPREFIVLRIEGNKAITKFRTFNRKIYHGNVYIYRGRVDTRWHANSYEVKKPHRGGEVKLHD